MSHHARHARAPQTQPTRRTTARVLGLAAVAGLGMAAAPAADAVTAPPANPMSDPAYDAMSVPMMDADVAPAAPRAGNAEFGDLHLYPLAGTPLDLLSNNLRVPVGGMDVSTFPVTAPFRDGLPLHAIPVVGALLPM